MSLLVQSLFVKDATFIGHIEINIGTYILRPSPLLVLEPPTYVVTLWEASHLSRDYSFMRNAPQNGTCMDTVLLLQCDILCLIFLFVMS
jgi:hypothetical protein